MKKTAFIVLLFIVQIPRSFAQSPFTTPDNIGSGNCLDFDGVDDYVITNPISNFPSNALTFTFWMNSSSNNEGTPISYANSSTDNAVLIQQPSNFVIGIENNFVVTNTAVNDGLWHNIAVTWTNTTQSILFYVDGELRYSGSINATIGGNGVLVFGQDQDVIGGGFQAIQSWDGFLDEIAIWNRVLSQTEIRDRMCRTMDPAMETGLIGYWDMNEGAGTTVTDLTTSGNDGTRM